MTRPTDAKLARGKECLVGRHPKARARVQRDGSQRLHLVVVMDKRGAAAGRARRGKGALSSNSFGPKTGHHGKALAAWGGAAAGLDGRAGWACERARGGGCTGSKGLHTINCPWVVCAKEGSHRNFFVRASFSCWKVGGRRVMFGRWALGVGRTRRARCTQQPAATEKFCRERCAEEKRGGGVRRQRRGPR
jgi:hypothetical protein